MTATTRHETWGPHVWIIDERAGTRTGIETDMLIVDDWRDTVLGCVNFGEVRVLQQRWVTHPIVEGDGR